jgi:histidyl-tRNA synthetase
MRDFLAADARRRDYVISIIKTVYQKYGFEPLETPALENLETLMGKYGEEGNQLIYKILKRGAHEKSGEADLALRYDLTVPLARVIANYRNELPKFFKRYQIQPVWRADKPGRGRFREFYQCDVDAIGSTSMLVEVDVFSAVADVLKTLGFTNFLIRLNHRQLLRGMLASSGIEAEKGNDALVVLDKLDKIGESGVLAEMLDRGIPEDSAKSLLGLIGNLNLLKDNSEIMTALRNFAGENEFGRAGCDDLDKILRLAKDLPIKIDPSLARGLSYYTGAIMEVELLDSGFKGSIGGGGRYDELIGMFGKEQIPACGFSLGLERILVVMDEHNMFPPELQNSAADVMITIWNEESGGESLQLASELRATGLRVLVYPEADKLGKQFKYAGQIGVPYVCVIGESELADGTVTVKNMETGEQETVARDGAAGKIAGK